MPSKAAPCRWAELLLNLLHIMTSHFPVVQLCRIPCCSLQLVSIKSSIHHAGAEQVGEEQGNQAKQAQQEYAAKLASLSSDVEAQEVQLPSPGKVLFVVLTATLYCQQFREPTCVQANIQNTLTLLCTSLAVHQNMLML